MSEDEFQMHLVERRAKQRLIGRGVRYDPVQRGFLPGEEPKGVEQPKYYGKKVRCRRK